MCISANVSISTFIISIISSFILIYYGVPKFKTENLIIGLFFIYIAIVQLLEWMMWFDINDNIGINKIATMIMPIYVYIQPLVLYNIQAFIYDVSSPWWWLLIEFLYLIVTGLQYQEFIKGSRLVTKCGESGGLKWNWSYYFFPHLYLFILFYSIFVFFNFKFACFLFIITLLSIILTLIKHNNYYDGEFGSLFCFIGALLPIVFIFFELLL
jgi:hypothetical protein